MIALALPRVRSRTRRRRPPSGRRLLYLAWRALCLGWLGRCAVALAAGHLDALVGVVFVGAYAFWTWTDRDARRLERLGATLPDVHPLEWASICVNAACLVGSVL